MVKCTPHLVARHCLVARLLHTTKVCNDCLRHTNSCQLKSSYTVEPPNKEKVDRPMSVIRRFFFFALLSLLFVFV